MDMLTTLMGGVAAIVGIFLALYIMTPIKGPRIAIILAFISMGLLIPYMILHWKGMDVLAIHIGIYLITCYLLGMVSGYREKRKARGEDPGHWFHWAPATIVAFFVVIVTVNVVFVSIAQNGLSTHDDGVRGYLARFFLPEPKEGTTGGITSKFTGTVARDYREKDATFDEYLEQLKRQEALGWSVKRGWVGIANPTQGEPAVFQIEVLDRDGRPVSGAVVDGKFLRPSTHTKDFPFSMQEVSAGLYRVEVAMPEPGYWNVLLKVIRGEDSHELQATTQVNQSLVKQTVN